MRILLLCLFAVAGLAEDIEIELLVEDLASRQTSRRRAAERTLAALGRDALPALRAYAEHASPVVRRGVRRLLERLGEQAPADARRLERAIRDLLEGPADGRTGAVARALATGSLGRRAVSARLRVPYGSLSLEMAPVPAALRVGQTWQTRMRLRYRGKPALMPLFGFSTSQGYRPLVSAYDRRITLARRGGRGFARRSWPLADLTRISVDEPHEVALAPRRLEKPGRYPMAALLEVGGVVRGDEAFQAGLVPVGAPATAVPRARSLRVRREIIVLPDWARAKPLSGGLTLSVAARPAPKAGGWVRATVTIRNAGAKALALPLDWPRSAYVALVREGDGGWVRWATVDRCMIAELVPDAEKYGELEDGAPFETRLVETLGLAPGATVKRTVRLRVPGRATGRATVVAGLRLYARESGATEGMGHDGIPRGQTSASENVDIRRRSGVDAAIEGIARGVARGVVRPR